MCARRYTDLDVWLLASEVRDKAHEVARRRSFDRYLWLREQMSRSAQSACANIAEGFGRFKPKEFARFLRISRGSLLEVAEHMTSAERLHLVTDKDLAAVTSLVNRAVAATTRLIRYLEHAKEPDS